MKIPVHPAFNKWPHMVIRLRGSWRCCQDQDPHYQMVCMHVRFALCRVRMTTADSTQSILQSERRFVVCTKLQQILLTGRRLTVLEREEEEDRLEPLCLETPLCYVSAFLKQHLAFDSLQRKHKHLLLTAFKRKTAKTTATTTKKSVSTELTAKHINTHSQNLPCQNKVSAMLSLSLTGWVTVNHHPPGPS